MYKCVNVCIYIGSYFERLSRLHICQGSVEGEVASKASPSPKGSITLDPDKFMGFLATYDTGAEQIKKSFTTVTDCCTWINKMDVATTAGALRKGLDAACRVKACDSAAQPSPS